MKKALIAFLAVIGFLSLIAAMFVVGITFLSVLGKPTVPSAVVLEINLEGGVVEAIPEDALAQVMMEGTPTLPDIVAALDRAADDRRVKGLVARIGGGGMGLAHLQELRDAVLRFRESGKPAWAFAETFGEFGPGNGGYYLSTAFDEVVLQPSGDVGLTGLIYITPFVRGLLDKLEIEPDMSQRYEYKNAMNFYTHREYTDAQREAMQRLMDSQFDQIIGGVADGRGFEVDEVRELADGGPYLASEALEHGLVDLLGYRDELQDRIDERLGEDASSLTLKAYIERSPARGRGTTIAFIQGDGAVSRGPSAYSPFDGSTSMGSDTITKAFRDAIDDDRVEAIVFRVNSPGGSYVASDAIWRETVRARDADKPVIVSMGNLAGSGGYFVAIDATKIVAQPGTITASIGVLGGKMITRGFWENKLGITFDEVSTSEHSAMWSGLEGFGVGRERFNASLDRIYEDFTSKVAEGRGLELERVHEIAKGRIWTGEDALGIGLVDELGGLHTAYRLAREELELAADAPIRIKRFPRRKTTLELFLRRDDSTRAAVGSLARALAQVQPTVRRMQSMLAPEGQALSMPWAPGAP